MELTIRISDETAATLSERAKEAGEGLAEYAAGIVKRTADAAKTLREISGPVAEQFEESGMTEDELGDFLEDVKHKMRRERRMTRG
jgi:hypothetical protein